jgi:hypothetical protein
MRVKQMTQNWTFGEVLRRYTPDKLAKHLTQAAPDRKLSGECTPMMQQ